MALIAGAYIRFARVFGVDFPLLDGGMFAVVIQDILNNHFAPPFYLSYNAAHIPFAYPPVGFYLAAVLARLTSVSSIEALRLTLLVSSCLCIPAAWLLARSMLRSEWAAAIAAVAFALIPRSLVSLDTGGGLPRAPGLFFALLALWQLRRLYERASPTRIITVIVLGSLAVMSHLEVATFLAISGPVFFLAWGRSRQRLIASGIVVAGVAVGTSPWWALVLVRYGASPFIGALQSGGGGTPLQYLVPFLLSRLPFAFNLTNEPATPLIGLLGMLGIYSAFRRNLRVLFVWWAAVLLLIPRFGTTLAAPATGMLAALALVDVAVPVVCDSLPFVRKWMAATAVVAVALGYAFWALVSLPAVPPPGSGTDLDLLTALTADQREAMREASDLTPPTARFAIISGRSWGPDLFSEWFPALTGRVSVATVQGLEWLPGTFIRREYDSALLQGCASASADCLDHWSAARDMPFNDVYLPREQDGDKVASLRASLEGDARYAVLFDGPGGEIFERLPMDPISPVS